MAWVGERSSNCPLSTICRAAATGRSITAAAASVAVAVASPREVRGIVAVEV